MPGGDKVRSLGGLFSRLGGHRPAEGSASASPAVREVEGAVVQTKALRKFLTYIGGREAPILLDLGPVVGSNVTFFGEQLNCKVYIEDLFADFDRHLRAGTVEQFPAFLASRFNLAEASVDGVLAWDLFDYLDRVSAKALAAILARLMHDGSALLGLFGNTAGQGTGFTKFVIADEAHLRQRHYPSAATRQRALQNRDIIKMFEGLRVSDSFLLQNNLREILFKKGAGGRPII